MHFVNSVRDKAHPVIEAFYHPGYAAPLGDHVMPIRKFGLVAEALRSEAYVALKEPSPVTEADLLLVHTQSYIDAVKTGTPKQLAESQKFPWSPELYPSVLLTNGGVLAACQSALKNGYGAAVASGFHHSHRERGEGYCTFNGLVLAGELLRKAKKLQTLAVLDMDLHYGNGTAFLAESRPWLRTLSLYGNDYKDNLAYRDVTTRQHSDGSNHRSEALPAGCDRTQMFEIMDRNLPFLIEGQKPDLLIFQAGADPFKEDPYSPLNLDHSDLFERDRKVFNFAKAHNIPVAWVLAGGYTKDVNQVVKVHTNTFAAWHTVFGNPKLQRELS